MCPTHSLCGKPQIHFGPAQTLCAGLNGESLEIAAKLCKRWRIAFSLSCYKAEDFSSAFSGKEEQQLEFLLKMSAI